MVAADNQKDTGQTDEIITASLTRPQTLEADVVRFQNNKDRWIAFIGLNDGQPSLPGLQYMLTSMHWYTMGPPN